MTEWNWLSVAVPQAAGLLRSVADSINIAVITIIKHINTCKPVLSTAVPSD